MGKFCLLFLPDNASFANFGEPNSLAFFEAGSVLLGTHVVKVLCPGVANVLQLRENERESET